MAKSGLSRSQRRVLNRKLIKEARYGDGLAIPDLLEQGANIEYEDKNDPFGATCLSEACRRGKHEMVELLLGHKANANHVIKHGISPLHLACEQGYENVVKILLKYGANADIQELFNLDSPIHMAAANNHAHICKILADANADINAQNRTGDTPLHVCVASRHLETCRMLLDLGVDFLLPNHAEMNPYHVAQISKNKKCEAILKEKIDKYYEERKEKRKRTRTAGMIGYESPSATPMKKHHKTSSIWGSISSGLLLTRHEIPDGVLFKKGWLKKQGKNFKNFQDRFFILYTGGVMEYYAKEIDTSGLVEEFSLNTPYYDLPHFDPQPMKLDTHTSPISPNQDLSQIQEAEESLTQTEEKESKESKESERQSKEVTTSSSNETGYFAKDSMDSSFPPLPDFPPDDNVSDQDQLSLGVSRLTESKLSAVEDGDEMQHSILSIITDVTDSNYGNSIDEAPDLPSKEHRECDEKTPNDTLNTDNTEEYSEEMDEADVIVHTDSYVQRVLQEEEMKEERKEAMKAQIPERKKKDSNSDKLFLTRSLPLRPTKDPDSPSFSFINKKQKAKFVKPKGRINLKNFIETQFLDFPNEPNVFGFALITKERTWKFKCPSDDDRREWIAAIHAVNYGLSPEEFRRFSLEISYQNNTFMYKRASNSFIHKDTTAMPVLEGWIYKIGDAVRGLESKYWKKRWLSLLRNPLRLVYMQHPNGQIKGIVALDGVVDLSKITDKDLLANEYRCPTMYAFQLITDKRTWVFACFSDNDCDMWVERIHYFWTWGVRKKEKEQKQQQKQKQKKKKKNPSHYSNSDMNDTAQNKNEGLTLSDSEVSPKDMKGEASEQGKGKKKARNRADSEKKKKGVMAKILRRVSDVAEMVGIAEQHAVISHVQPKGSVVPPEN